VTLTLNLTWTFLLQDHVNWYCWTHNLYHYPNITNRTQMPYKLNSLGGSDDPDVPLKGQELGEVTFFRWVTTIFLVQAFLFKVSGCWWWWWWWWWW
jgi:hypothetical protein